jgi:hypothetical protein
MIDLQRVLAAAAVVTRDDERVASRQRFVVSETIGRLDQRQDHGVSGVCGDLARQQLASLAEGDLRLKRRSRANDGADRVARLDLDAEGVGVVACDLGGDRPRVDQRPARQLRLQGALRIRVG